MFGGGGSARRRGEGRLYQSSNPGLVKSQSTTFVIHFFNVLFIFFLNSDHPQHPYFSCLWVSGHPSSLTQNLTSVLTVTVPTVVASLLFTCALLPLLPLWLARVTAHSWWKYYCCIWPCVIYVFSLFRQICLDFVVLVEKDSHGTDQRTHILDHIHLKCDTSCHELSFCVRSSSKWSCLWQRYVGNSETIMHVF